MKEVKGLEIDIPDQNDFDPGLWDEMKLKKFISTCEKIKGRDGLWQLSFKNGILYFIQFNIEFGSRSENAYNNCMDICKSILKINNSIRNMKDQLTGSDSKSFLEFKSEALSDSGVPNGYCMQFARYTWRSSEKSAYLSASCTWPDSMSVEYREEPL
jgi:hypothetical protein